MIIKNINLEPTVSRESVCSHHGIYTSRLYDDTDNIWSSCPKCRSELEQYQRFLANEKLIANNKVNKINNLFNNASIPLRFKECGFDNYNITNDKQKATVDKLQQYANGFVRQKGQDLILLGKVGTGKTHLANAIANHLIKNEFSAVYTTIHSIMDKLYEAGFDRHTELSKYIEPEFLIIDEISAKLNDDTSFNLFKIVDGRYQAMRPTCIISNNTMKELKAVIGDRTGDRVLTDAIIIEFGWKSNRVKK